MISLLCDSGLLVLCVSSHKNPAGCSLSYFSDAVDCGFSCLPSYSQWMEHSQYRLVWSGNPLHKTATEKFQVCHSWCLQPAKRLPYHALSLLCDSLHLSSDGTVGSTTVSFLGRYHVSMMLTQSGGMLAAFLVQMPFASLHAAWWRIPVVTNGGSSVASPSLTNILETLFLTVFLRFCSRVSVKLWELGCIPCICSLRESDFTWSISVPLARNCK